MNKKFDLNKLLNKPTALFEKYHQKSKIISLSKDNLDPKKWPKEWKTVNYKGYGRLDEIKLPPPQIKINMPLTTVLAQRSSGRKFSVKPIKLSYLSTLLYHSAGINKTDREKVIRRFYPSAGGRYPLEAYFLSLNCEIKNGLYHYYLKNHSLETLVLFKKLELNKYFSQPWIVKASGLIIITAVFKRNTIKYADRGYRHILIEAGHLGQNIYLVSNALCLSCCAIGGYVDDNLNQLLDIDGINESVIYVLAVGNN